MHSILRTQCEGESHWVSCNWSCTYHHAENISSGKILCRERLIRTMFIPTPAEPIILPMPQSWPFLPWIFHAKESSIWQNPLFYVIALSRFSLQCFRGFTEAGQGFECHLMWEKTSAFCCQFSFKDVFLCYLCLGLHPTSRWKGLPSSFVLSLFRALSFVQGERITVIFCTDNSYLNSLPF